VPHLEAGGVAQTSSERQSTLDASALVTARSCHLPVARDAEGYAWLTVLRIQLLGRMAVECDGSELAVPSARRAWSLLAYLALSPGPQPRGDLAAQFWPDVLDSSARASLRSAVWSLRRTLGPAAEPHLIVDRNCVGLAPGPQLWVDIHAFDTLARAGREREAVQLCTGELLAGFEEEWALMARDAHRERLLEVLEQLACSCDAVADTDEALEWSRRAIAVDPLSEDAHRHLIARLAASGDRARALMVYRALGDRLRRELSVAPSPATRALVERLRIDTDDAPLDATGPDGTAVPTTDQPTARPRTPSTPSQPLVGRARELDRLLEAWRGAQAGVGAVVSVCGEAGIGKTRLASELLTRASEQGATTAACAALDLGGAAPFGLWAELLRKLLASVPIPPAEAAWPEDLARLVPDILVLLARPGSERPVVSPDLERARLLEAVVAAIEWAARAGPLALLLEDTHIADPSSLELTGYVARRIERLAVLFVLTRRPLPRSTEVDRLEHALRSRGLLGQEVALGPLEPAAVAEIALDVAALGQEDVTKVVHASEGNALLAVETARAISRGERELAEGVRGAVRGAFGSLSDAGRRLVELAAVAARELEHGEVIALPIEDSADAAVQALDSGMLCEREGRLGFRHALLREAAYFELPQPRRVVLHERWAQTLLRCASERGPSRAAEVARHLRLAGKDQQAVEQLSLAAADARAVGALVEAAGYLQEAVEMAGDNAELALELAEVQAWRGLREDAERAFASAKDLLAGSPLALARAWLRSARWYHGPICAPTMVRQCCSEALALLDRLDADVVCERREALAALAWAEAVAGSVEEAERLLVQVHELSRGSQADDLSVYDVAHARALALMRRGAFVEGYAPAIAAGEAITRAGRPDLAYGCWGNVAGAAAAAGDFERALEFIDRARTALEGKGLVGIEVQLLSMRSFVLLRIGRIAQAHAAVEEEATLADRLGAPEIEAMAAHDRGIVALAQGHHVAAAELLEQALARAAPISRPLTRLRRAEALARAGRLAEAERELRAMTLEPVRPSDFPATLVARMARVQGLMAALAGDPELAERRLGEAAQGWRRQVQTLSRGDSLTVALADLGRPVVGLIEPEWELECVLKELNAIQRGKKGAEHAVVS
jgi:DNA-binding SARP family transcriptional activator/tetratricopeptide (TPR) repeat protein